MNDGKQSNYWKPNEEDTQSNIDNQTPLHPSLDQLVHPNQAIQTEATQDNVPTRFYPPSQSPELPETDMETSEAEVETSGAVEWSAQEYYSDSKSKGWYIVLIIGAIVLMAVSIFLLNSWSFAVLIVVMLVSLIVYTRRSPAMIRYTLSIKQGLYIGDKLYNLQDYKAFSLSQGSNQNSIILIPVKRFSPGLSVYFPSEAGEKIVDILASRLPMEEYNPDLVDKMIEKLKF